MSLLREAERCIANQTRFLELNSVITPLQSSAAWVQRVRDADVRRENGTIDLSINCDPRTDEIF
jgi:aspartyl-tRNA(Asn)/glutamyl-tRNA(Gln) amidotransferase subunit A